MVKCYDHSDSLQYVICSKSSERTMRICKLRKGVKIKHTNTPIYMYCGLVSIYGGQFSWIMGFWLLFVGMKFLGYVAFQFHKNTNSS